MALQFDRDAFEKRLRALIESGAMELAETLIRDAANDAGELPLLAALDRPLSAMAVEGWTSIGADMVDAKLRVPPMERGQEFQAVFAGLVNHTGHDELYVEITFGFSSEPSKPSAGPKPSFMTEAQFEEFKQEQESRVFLPSGPRYRGDFHSPGLKITGAGDLLAIEREAATANETQEEQGRRWRRQTLSAGAILLRFHQLLERYSANPGLPRPMPIFAHVAYVEWPMEQGIYEYGTTATRLLQASSDHYDLGARDRLLGDRARQRGEEFLAETRQVICELRERELALDLWPWWRHPARRADYAQFVRMERKVMRRALAQVYGVEARSDSTDELARLFAEARHPHNAVSALEPIGPERRGELHRLIIAFAKRFGGSRIRERFADQLDPSRDILGK